MMLYPLLIGGVSILASIVGRFVKLGRSQKITEVLLTAIRVTAILSAILIFFITKYWLGFDSVYRVYAVSFNDCILRPRRHRPCVTGLLMWITEYYTMTKHCPVQSIAKASVTGHGTNIIPGLAVSMEATALPVLVICAGIMISYIIAYLFGIAIAASTMYSCRHGRSA